MDDTLTMDEAIEHVRKKTGVVLTRATMYNNRSRGTGPKSHRIAGRIVYRTADLDEWADEQAHADPLARRHRRKEADRRADAMNESIARAVEKFGPLTPEDLERVRAVLLGTPK